MIKFRIIQDVDYSLCFSAATFLNRVNDHTTQNMMLLQALNYLLLFENPGTFKLTSSFVHNLGVQHFFDSLTLFQPDDNTLTSRFDYKISRHFNLSFSSLLATRIMTGYDYVTNDSGDVVKIMNSSFLTPFTGIFSFGSGIILPAWGNLNLGVSSAKLTVLSNTRIFNLRHVEMYHGIPRGKNYRFEYGLSLQILIDKEIFKRIQWNCDLLLFKNFHSPIDMALKNLFGIKINKFLKTSIHTKVFYEEEVSRSLRVENLISVGFYFTL